MTKTYREFLQEMALRLSVEYKLVSDEEVEALLQRGIDKERTKRDKFDYPYYHDRNVPVDADGKIDLHQVKVDITTRPESILKQNAKMKKTSMGQGNINVLNFGIPALKGLVVDEEEAGHPFAIVNTCPGAGECKLFCYAKKGFYTFNPGVSLSDARKLNYLLNDPRGFMEDLSNEITFYNKKKKAVSPLIKNTVSDDGFQLCVRWHDAGDFFSQEYLEAAFDVARDHPDVLFYAYTKMANVVNHPERPPNFEISFSDGSLASEQGAVDTTQVKYSAVVKNEVFWDLVQKDGRKKVYNEKGVMQLVDGGLETLKHRLAESYNISAEMILTYDEMMDTPVDASRTGHDRYHCIVFPGEGDNSAFRSDIRITFLIFH